MSGTDRRDLQAWARAYEARHPGCSGVIVIDAPPNPEGIAATRAYWRAQRANYETSYTQFSADPARDNFVYVVSDFDGDRSLQRHRIRRRTARYLFVAQESDGCVPTARTVRLDRLAFERDGEAFVRRTRVTYHREPLPWETA